MVSGPGQYADGIFNSASRFVASNPVVLFIACLVFLLIVTRFTSGSNAIGDSSGKSVRLLPYWIPYIGHALSYGASMSEFVANIRDHSKESITAIYVGGKRHNLVTMPSVALSLSTLRPSVLSTHAISLYLMKAFFGDRGTMGTMKLEHWSHDIHRVLNLLLKEPFLSNAVAKTASMIEERGPNLVSFSESIIDQHHWERATGVKVLGNDFSTVETDLVSLIRNFVGEVACEVLMGSAFMANNPDALQDLQTMDSKFNLFMLGIPGFAAPGMRQAIAARSRLLDGMGKFGDALDAVDDGRDPGFSWTDMSDVSALMWERRRAWRRCNSPPEAYNAGDLAILWAANVNANLMVFWTLYHILSEQSLQESILKEIAPYARLQQEKTGLLIDPPPRVKFDISGILNRCPLLKATYLESMRVDSASVSYKEIVTDFEVTEKQQDAELNGKTRPDTYALKRGQYIASFHGARQSDPRFFPDPTKFDPKRFLITEKNDPSKVYVDPQSLTPYGGGHAMCKGRLFAEKEILLFVSSILMAWEIAPTDPTRGWLHPGQISGSSTYLPKSAVKVRISRRRPLA